jgi:tetratricopeptide (TPR) repeat protein
VEWLTEVSEQAAFDLGAAFLKDAVARSLEDVERHPESARSHTNLAQAFWQAGDMNAAAEHCRIAIEKGPESYVARLLLARVREVQGRLADANALYEELHLKRPDDIPPLMGLAHAAIRRSDFARARDLLLRVIELDSEATVPRFNLGMVLLRMGRPNDAIGHLKQAARSDVRSPILHHALGLAYWSQGSRRRAEQQFRSALHLLPSYRPAVRSLAHLLIQGGKPAEALPILETYLAQNADSEGVRDLFGWALFEKKDYRHAIEQLRLAFSMMEQSQRDGSELARVANNIGVCYARLREWRNAEGWYGRAIGLNRRQPEALHNLARLYLETNSADRAIQLLEGVGELNPDDLEAMFLLALAKNNIGRGGDAIDELARLVRKDNAPVAAFSFLGMLLADEADAPADAVPVLEEGYRRFPKDPMVANNLAYALLLAGRPADARQVLEQYPEASVTDVYLRATWGLLHLREGHLEEGIRGYDEAQQLAQRLGHRELSRQAKQKKHLELARTYLERGDIQSAAQEVTFGLGTPGKPAYERVLRQLQRSLPERT